MENLALIDSFSDFKDEKLIDRVTLMVILEEVFRNTLRRKYEFKKVMIIQVANPINVLCDMISKLIWVLKM